jgi:large subunit ribosomal protein L35
MPKMKTKSSVKKRFKVTGSGRVKAGVAKKRHNLGSKSQKMKRTSRRTFVVASVDTPALKRFMPYG